jgi:hypothetical protein
MIALPKYNFHVTSILVNGSYFTLLKRVVNGNRDLVGQGKGTKGGKAA